MNPDLSYGLQPLFCALLIVMPGGGREPAEERDERAAARVRMLALLLDAGADPNFQWLEGMSPLHFPTLDYQSARLLLKAGANPELKDRRGLSALETQRRIGRPEVIYLLERLRHFKNY